MQTHEIIAGYQAEIASLDVAIGAANNARTAIETLTRQIDVIESESLLAGIEGKTAEERKARFTLTGRADDLREGPTLLRSPGLKLLADERQRVARPRFW